MLRFVMNISPLAISTTGRGSTGVGLTAAVSVDRESNEKMLEAGAMVLADRGLVCIDEFDKMSVGDRVAIHEVMEQQTVTIAKAGIHTSLNARCSVLAAANPLYGNFDPSIDLNKNINLPDSILSRFDLVYIVRDLLSKEEDRKISAQVLRQLRYRHAEAPSASAVQGKHQFGVSSSYLEPRAESVLEQASSKKDNTSDVFDKHLMAMAALDETRMASGKQKKEFVSIEFLRKYISYAKSLPAPRLSEAAIDAIAEVYTLMRQQSANGEAKFSVAVTPRALEALIRLATAHAKLHLRSSVEPADVSAVHELLQACRGSLSGESLDAEEDEGVSPLEEELMEIEELNDENSAPSNRPASSSSRKRNPPTAASRSTPPQDEDETMGEPSPKKKVRTIQNDTQASALLAAVVAEERLAEFRGHCAEVLSCSTQGFTKKTDLFREINKRTTAAGQRRFGEGEAQACLDKLGEAGKVFVTGDDVYSMA